MDAHKLEDLINTTRTGYGKGRLFEVTFIKKNGQSRLMRCRLGMQRNLTGKGMTWNPRDKSMMTVWSADTRDYRLINLNTITNLRLPDNSKHLIAV